MQSPLFISAYVFALVFMFLGGICVLLRMLGRIFETKRSNHSRRPKPERRAASANNPSDPPAHRLPNFVPPPTPRTDQEYWRAEQYCFEHDLPAPLPPPRRERDEW
jgi:hypothetical protein